MEQEKGWAWVTLEEKAEVHSRADIKAEQTRATTVTNSLLSFITLFENAFSLGKSS